MISFLSWFYLLIAYIHQVSGSVSHVRIRDNDGPITKAFAEGLLQQRIRSQPTAAALMTSNTPILGCPVLTSAVQFTSTASPKTFKSPTPTDSTIEDSTITSYPTLETSTASILCTTLGAAPGLGRNRNACVCTAESTTVTLPMQVITSDDSKIVTCNYHSIPSAWSAIFTSTAVWTDSANCQVCSQAGVVNPRKCDVVADCTPAITTIYTRTYTTTSFTVRKSNPPHPRHCNEVSANPTDNYSPY